MCTGERAASYSISADIESMTWDPFCPYHLYCSLENGEIVCIDIRIPGTPLCCFQGHDKTVSAISFSSGVPGLMASSSVDKTVKLWDVSNLQKIDPTPFSSGSADMGAALQGVEPHVVMYKTMNVGKLFALQYYTDDPFVLATAGDKGSVAVWECDEAETVKNYFQDRAVRTADSVVDGHDSNSVSAALTLPGHAAAMKPIVTDDSWMDDSEPIIEEKKTKKIKNKEKVKNNKNKK